jgi:glyoxylate utilization-related uncharacterized protein
MSASTVQSLTTFDTLLLTAEINSSSEECCLQCRLIFILDGVLELSYDKHSIALHSDDFAYLPAHVPHRYSEFARQTVLRACCCATTLDTYLAAYQHSCEGAAEPSLMRI